MIGTERLMSVALLFEIRDPIDESKLVVLACILRPVLLMDLLGVVGQTEDADIVGGRNDHVGVVFARLDLLEGAEHRIDARGARSHAGEATTVSHEARSGVRSDARGTGTAGRGSRASRAGAGDRSVASGARSRAGEARSEVRSDARIRDGAARVHGSEGRGDRLVGGIIVGGRNDHVGVVCARLDLLFGAEDRVGSDARGTGTAG